MCLMILSFILVIFNVSNCFQENYTNFELSQFIAAEGKIQDYQNLTIYLGYANNPFGPSAPVFTIKKTFDEFQTETLIPNRIKTKNLFTKNHRSRRDVLDLYGVVRCATGCNPLIYKGYGCYCGFLGSGRVLDGIDSCCRSHDWCYETTKCPTLLQYFVPYLWTCFRNKPLCAIQRDQNGGPGSCAQRLCECDRLLGECLSKFPCPSSRAMCRSSAVRLFQNAVMLFK